MSRVSTEAVKFNIAIAPATVAAGQPVYRVRDIFTTRDGSWEPSGVPGAIPQWARDAYLRPWGAPDYFDDGGGDHHMFGAIVDATTNRTIKPAAIHYWTWTDNANHVTMPVKDKSGWANVLMFNIFYPDLDADPNTGARGAWAWTPAVDGIAADVVKGGGMPFDWHVSFFITWELTTGVGEPPPPPPDDVGSRIAALETWARGWSTNHPGGPVYV